jgi:hypothetical protein
MRDRIEYCGHKKMLYCVYGVDRQTGELMPARLESLLKRV